jgi:hypothetical protein
MHQKRGAGLLATRPAAWSRCRGEYTIDFWVRVQAPPVPEPVLSLALG